MLWSMWCRDLELHKLCVSYILDWINKQQNNDGVSWTDSGSWTAHQQEASELELPAEVVACMLNQHADQTCHCPAPATSSWGHLLSLTEDLRISKCFFGKTKVIVCYALKSQMRIFAFVFLTSFCAVIMAWIFLRQHCGRGPSFPEAGLCWPTNEITMVCYCLNRPRRSLTRTGVLLPFPQLLSV